MTNCPNCGAPYALDSSVCAYCGTAREGLKNDRKDVEIIKTLSGKTYRLPLEGYTPDEQKDAPREMELIDPLSGARDLNGNLYRRFQRAGKKPFNPDATIYTAYTHPNGDVEWGYAKFDSKSGVIGYPFEKTVKVDRAITVNLQQAAVNASFARAAYEQDVHAREVLQAQIARNAAARRVEDCARTAFIVCIVTALTVIARAALILIW